MICQNPKTLAPLEIFSKVGQNLFNLMHIERRAREKIVTSVLVTATAVLSAVCMDLALRPDIKPRTGTGSLLNPPGPETVHRSSASNYEALKIPPPSRR